MMNGYIENILAGVTVTLETALGSLLVATLLGLLGAACKLSPNRLLSWLAEVYSTVIRGVPDLVLMLLIFYGGQMAVNAVAVRLAYGDYVEINPFVAGILTLGFIYGAYLTETFRGAIMGVPKGQSEAGLAYGMSPQRVFFRLVVPQMIRLALPGFTNNWLVLTKATALVSIIGLQDMMYRAKQAGDATREPFIYFSSAALVYLMITSLSLLVLREVNRRYSVGVREGDI